MPEENGLSSPSRCGLRNGKFLRCDVAVNNTARCRSQIDAPERLCIGRQQVDDAILVLIVIDAFPRGPSIERLKNADLAADLPVEIVRDLCGPGRGCAFGKRPRSRDTADLCEDSASSRSIEAIGCGQPEVAFACGGGRHYASLRERSLRGGE